MFTGGPAKNGYFRVVAPAAPTNLVATGGDASVALSWTGVTGVTTYKVKRSLAEHGTYQTLPVTATGTTYNDTELDNGTTYYYKVSSYTGSESADSNIDHATPTAPVVSDTVAPTVAITSPTGGAQISLWSNQSLPAISGSASDGGSGIKNVKASIKRQSDNKYWDSVSTTWVTGEVQAVSSYADGSWVLSSGLPAYNKLTTGAYDLKAVAYDKANNQTSSTVTVTITLLSGIKNDNFANAEPLGGYKGQVSATTVGSTLETNEIFWNSSCSIWYKWTAPITATIKVSNTFGVRTNFFSGSSFGTLVYESSSNNSNPYSVSVTQGQTYYIAVTQNQASFTMDYEIAPVGDMIGNRINLVSPPITGTTTAGSINGRNINATTETGEPEHGGNLPWGVSGRSIWYDWLAPSTGKVVWQVTNQSFDAVVAAYPGTVANALGSLEQLDQDSNQSRFAFWAVSGTSYRIVVATRTLSYEEAYGQGTYTLNWNLTAGSDNVPAAPTISAITHQSLIATAPAIPSGATSLVLQFKTTTPSNSQYRDLATVATAGTTTLVKFLTPATEYSFRYVAKSSFADTAGTAVSATTGPVAPTFGTKTATNVDVITPGYPSAITFTIQRAAVGTTPILPTVSTQSLTAWFKADSLPATQGGYVASWKDSGLRGNHASQIYDEYCNLRPRWGRDATTGFPVVQFEGKSTGDPIDPGDTGSALRMPSQSYNFANGFSAFVVVKPRTWGGRTSYVELGSSGTNGLGLGEEEQVDGIRFKQSGNGDLEYTVNNKTERLGEFKITGAVSSGSFQLLGVVQQAGSPLTSSPVSFFKNGSLLGTKSIPIPPIANVKSNYIGRSFGGNAAYGSDIAEVLIFDKALTETERTALENYLHLKYSLGGDQGDLDAAGLTWTTIATNQNRNSTYTDSGRVANTSYWYRCNTATAKGAAAFLQPAPAVPAAPGFYGTDWNSIDVGAPAMPTNATSMKLQWKATTGGTYADYADNIAGGQHVIVRGLNASTNYTFRMVAIGSGGTTNGLESNRNTTASALPEAPGKPIVVATTPWSITVKTPAWPRHTKYLKFQIKAVGSPDNTYDTFAELIGPDEYVHARAFGGHSIEAETEYQCRFIAYGDGNPEATATGEIANVWTPPLAAESPGPPIFVSADATSVQVQAPALPLGASSMKLQKSVGNEAAYADVSGATGIGAGDVTDVTGLTTGTLYYFRYVAIGVSNAVGASRSILLQTPPPAPPAPVLHSVSSVGFGLVVPNIPTGATGLQLELKRTDEADSTYAIKATYNQRKYFGPEDVGKLFFFDGLIIDTSYSIRWVSVIYQPGAGGFPYRTPGPSTTFVTVAESALPGIPDPPEFQAVGQTSLEVVLPDLPARAVSMKLQRKVAGAESWTYWPNNTTPASYGSGPAPVAVTGLTADTDYRFRVEAINGTGSTFSAEAGVSTGTAPPAAPAAPTFAGLTDSSVEVTAPAMPDRARTMVLQISNNGGASYVDITTVTEGAVVTLVTGLESGATYTLRYVAMGVGGKTAGAIGTVIAGVKAVSWSVGSGVISCEGINWSLPTTTVARGTAVDLRSYLATDWDPLNTTVTIGGVTGSPTSVPHADPCTYTWSATGGTFQNSLVKGQSVVWVAPASSGDTFTITLTVDDQGGANGQPGPTSGRDDNARQFTMTITVP
jgi:hypothetical protein